MKTVVLDAWRMIVPLPNDRHGPLSPLLLSLTFLTGLVDAFSYLALGHVFVANVTGSVVFLAFALAGTQGFSRPTLILALVAFSLGAFAGGRVITKLRGHRGHLLTVASACECILVAGAVVLATRNAPSGTGIETGPAQFGLIILLGLAMGLQNAAARHLAVPDLTTTVLTLTITGITADSHPAGGAGSRLGRRGLAVLAMFVGALVGVLLVIGGSGPISLVLALVVLGGLTATAAVVSRANPSWAHPMPMPRGRIV
jgi:uncharacterized membrane protein YoaK (UPF0700 family)